MGNKTDRSIKILVIIVLSMTVVILGWVIVSIVYPYFAIQSLNFATNKVGKAIQIQSISRTNVYVQNVGDSDVVLSSFYVNGVRDSGAVFSKTTLKPAETATITPSTPFTEQQVTVKIVSTDGTFIEFTKTF